MNFMKKDFLSFLTFALLVFSSSKIFAAPSSQKSVQVPDINESFVITNADGSEFSEENLDGDQIIKFSMYFGLLDESSPDFQNAFSSYQNLRDYLETSGIENLDEEAKGEAILTAMYEKILTQYRLNQTKVDVALNSGTYNCVSSALLYLALASDFGLDARVQETAKHAFITLYLSDGRKIDVETTNPFGFNPGTKKQVSSSANSKRYATVPRNYYSNRKEISRRRAVTLVAKNLCAGFNEKDDYIQAVPLAAASLTFVTKEKSDARNDFDTVAGNFAVFADKNHKAETGLDFLDEVFSRYGKTEYLLNVYNDISYNSAAFYCNQNDFEEANSDFEKRKENLTQKNQNEIQKMIFETRTFYEAQNLDSKNPDEGIKYVQNARKSDYTASDASFRQNLEKLEESLWSAKIVPVFNAQNYLEAAKICDEGLLSLPKSAYLKNSKNAALQNHANEVHNQIVPLLNSQKYDEASEILKAGLEKNPSSRLLQNDLKRLQSAR